MNPVPKLSELRDVIDLSSHRKVVFKSFDQRQKQIYQINTSLENIRDYMYNEGKLCLFPRLGDNTGTIRTALHVRIKSLFSEGFVFMSTSMASAANLDSSGSCSSASLEDVFLLTPDRPGCFFSVVDDDTDQRGRQQTLKHVVSLSRGIVQNMRRFCDVQFSLVYGIITNKDLSYDDTFKRALGRLVSETSRLSVPVALSMHVEKYSNIVQAFILSISIAKCLSNAANGHFECLTPGQFRIIQENLLEKKVDVKVMPHSGQKVLMLELVARLDKNGDTILVSEDDKLRRMAVKQGFSTQILNPDEYVKRKGEFINVVTDYEKETFDVKGKVWKFVKQTECLTPYPSDDKLKAGPSRKMAFTSPTEFKVLNINAGQRDTMQNEQQWRAAIESILTAERPELVFVQGTTWQGQEYETLVISECYDYFGNKHSGFIYDKTNIEFEQLQYEYSAKCRFKNRLCLGKMRMKNTSTSELLFISWLGCNTFSGETRKKHLRSIFQNLCFNDKIKGMPLLIGGKFNLPSNTVDKICKDFNLSTSPKSSLSGYQDLMWAHSNNLLVTYPALVHSVLMDIQILMLELKLPAIDTDMALSSDDS